MFRLNAPQIKLSALTPVLFLIFLIPSSICFAREQPLYVVSNDDTSDVIGHFADLMPMKPRKVISADEASRRCLVYCGAPEKEESSVILVNREKNTVRFSAFGGMFGVDLLRLGQRELVIEYRPKGGRNPNAALLVSAPDHGALKYGIGVFMRRSARQNIQSGFHLREDLYPCLVYSDFVRGEPDLEEMGFLCKPEYYNYRDRREFLSALPSGHTIFILNAGNLKNLTEEIRRSLPCDAGDAKPNDFLICGKQADGKYRVLMVAPTERILVGETRDRRKERLPRSPERKTYPDLRGYSSVAVVDMNDESGEGAGVADAIRSVLESGIPGLGGYRLSAQPCLERKSDAKKDKPRNPRPGAGGETTVCADRPDLIVTGDIASTNGEISYHVEQSRLTPEPVFNMAAPAKPVCEREDRHDGDCHDGKRHDEKCGDDKQKVDKCADDERRDDKGHCGKHRDDECRKKWREYEKDLAAYNEAEKKYERKLTYDTYQWMNNFYRDSSLEIYGKLRIEEVESGETLYSAYFYGRASASRNYNSTESSVTGALNRPDAPSQPPASRSVDPGLIRAAVSDALAKWYEEFDANVILR